MHICETATNTTYIVDRSFSILLFSISHSYVINIEIFVKDFAGTPHINPQHQSSTPFGILESLVDTGGEMKTEL